MQKEKGRFWSPRPKMQSLIGLSVFLFGSSLLILVMLALWDMPPLGGLIPIFPVFNSMIFIGIGFFVMFYAMLRAIEKGIVDVPRAVFTILIITVGCLGFIWSVFYNSYLGNIDPYFGCPADGMCWSALQLPLASIIVSDLGAILLQTSFVKKRVHVKALATPLPQTR